MIVMYSIMFSVGVAAWVYAKFSHRINDIKSSVIAAAAVGLIAFIVCFTFFKVFLHY